MGKDPLTEVLPYYQQLEELETRAESSSFNAGVFDVAIKNCVDRISELCANPEVSEVLAAEYGKFLSDSQELDYLEGTGHVDEDILKLQRAALTERADSPTLKLARRFAGALSLHGAEVDKPEAVPSGETEGLAFFLRPPEVVAEELIGKKIRVKDRTAVITKTKPQDSDYNEQWSDDPLFGKDRVDAMVDRYRGYNILYLRAGDERDTLSCVRIVGVEFGGKKYSTASKVCNALGLDEEAVGDIRFDGKTIRIVKLRQPNTENQ